MSDSAPHPGTITEKNTVDTREDLAPLNLSTRNSDKDKCPSDHRLSSLEAEKSKREELPLNLSLRASHSSSIAQSMTTNASDDPQQSHDPELYEEPCDQRQTAALALCQLASASSAASSCDFSPQEEPREDGIKASALKKTKHATKAKATSMKRANSVRAENKCHKPNKRAKIMGRPLRRRPRCS